MPEYRESQFLTVAIACDAIGSSSYIMFPLIAVIHSMKTLPITCITTAPCIDQCGLLRHVSLRIVSSFNVRHSSAAPYSFLGCFSGTQPFQYKPQSFLVNERASLSRNAAPWLGLWWCELIHSHISIFCLGVRQLSFSIPECQLFIPLPYWAMKISHDASCTVFRSQPLHSYLIVSVLAFQN